MIKSIDCHNIPFDELYPRLAVDDFKDNELIDNWMEHFENFKKFYQNALNDHRAVAIVIG